MKIKQTFVMDVKSIGTVTAEFWVSKDGNGYIITPVGNPKDALYKECEEWDEFEVRCAKEYERTLNEKENNENNSNNK